MFSARGFLVDSGKQMFFFKRLNYNLLTHCLPWILPEFYRFSLGTRKSFSPLCTQGSIHCVPLWCTLDAVSGTRVGRTQARPLCTRTGSSSVPDRNVPRVCRRSRCHPRIPCPGSHQTQCSHRRSAPPRLRRNPRGYPPWPVTQRSGPTGGRRQSRGEGPSFAAALTSTFKTAVWMSSLASLYPHRICPGLHYHHHHVRKWAAVEKIEDDMMDDDSPAAGLHILTNQNHLLNTFPPFFSLFCLA